MATTTLMEEVTTGIDTSSPAPNKSNLASITKWLFVVIIPIITIVGIIGNILIHLTMKRRGRPTSVSVFMSALAFADTMVLVLDFLNNWLEMAFNVDVLKNRGFCVFHRYFFNVAYTYATWLVVAIAVERFIVVWFPLKARSICTVRGSVVTVTGMFVGFCIFYLYNIWGWSVSDEGSCSVTQPMAEFLNNVAPWLTATMYAYCPLIIIFVTSSAIIFRLSQASAQRMEMSGADSKKDDATRKTTIMMLSICISFFILTFPVSVWYIMIFMKGLFVDMPPAFFLGETIILIFALLNHAINFFLYGLTSHSFRRDVLALIGCRKRGLGGSGTSVSGNTELSTVSTAKTDNSI